MKNKRNILSILRVGLYTLVFVVFAWVLVHVFALLGVFMVLAYPLWWLLFPSKSQCFLCQALDTGATCSFCKRRVVDNRAKPRNFRSVLLNTGLILIFSIVSFVIVYNENKLLETLSWKSAPATVTFAIPAKGQYKLGETFPMTLEISNVKVAVNAVQVDASFDPKYLEVIDITTENSFATIFVQKEINNKAGYLRIAGGLSNPGFSGEQGTFATIHFRGLQTGPTQVAFLPTSMVLANDGKGSNVLKELAVASYLILPSDLPPRQDSQVSLSGGVLGSTTPKTQLHLYEEEAILGASSANTESLSDVKPTSNPRPFALLSQVNEIIVEFWKTIGLSVCQFVGGCK